MTADDDVRDADAALLQGEDPPSRHQPLDRGLIVDAAVTFIDEQGLPGLTMRRLGQALGVEAMALYRYVSGKEELLDAVVDHLVEGMRTDAEVLDRPHDGWQDFVQRLAHGVRRVALAHPKAFPLVASRPPEAPWLRPRCAASTGWRRSWPASSRRASPTRPRSPATARSPASCWGTCSWRCPPSARTWAPSTCWRTRPHPGLEDYPIVSRLRSQLAQDTAAVEFEEALEALLERLALVRQEAGSA